MPPPSKTERRPRMFARVELEGGQLRGKLHIYDAIGAFDGITARDVVAKLEELKDGGACALDVHINSPGGDVFEGMATFTALASWPKGETHVHIDGLAASIASIIAMAGTRISIAPHAMVMVHGPRAFAMGEAGEMRKVAERLEAVRGSMADCYAKRTGLPKDDVLALMDAETWMSADEAVTKGFADCVAGRAQDDDETDEQDAARFQAVASALFAKAPRGALKLLTHLPPPVAADKDDPKMTAEETAAMTAQAAELTARVETLQKMQAELFAVTGKATVGEAMAVVAGLKEKSAQVDVLQAELAKRDAAAAQAAEARKAAEIKALYDEACKDGRLSPAKRAALEASGHLFTKTPTDLKAYLDCLPVQAKPIEAAPTAAPVAAELPPQLTEDEKNYAALLKLDPAMVLAFKSGQKQ